MVAELFDVVRPTLAFFGQKGAQQAVVIRRMARDLDMPLDVVVGETVRAPDGLAHHRPLEVARAPFQAGERDAEILRRGRTRLIDDAVLGPSPP